MTELQAKQRPAKPKYSTSFLEGGKGLEAVSRRDSSSKQPSPFQSPVKLTKQEDLPLIELDRETDLTDLPS